MQHRPCNLLRLDGAVGRIVERPAEQAFAISRELAPADQVARAVGLCSRYPARRWLGRGRSPRRTPLRRSRTRPGGRRSSRSAATGLAEVGGTGIARLADAHAVAGERGSVAVGVGRSTPRRRSPESRRRRSHRCRTRWRRSRCSRRLVRCCRRRTARTDPLPLVCTKPSPQLAAHAAGQAVVLVAAVAVVALLAGIQDAVAAGGGGRDLVTGGVTGSRVRRLALLHATLAEAVAAAGVPAPHHAGVVVVVVAVVALLAEPRLEDAVAAELCWHCSLQPSPGARLPSSHSSPGLTTPLPQIDSGWQRRCSRRRRSDCRPRTRRHRRCRSHRRRRHRCRTGWSGRCRPRRADAERKGEAVSRCDHLACRRRLACSPRCRWRR